MATEINENGVMVLHARELSPREENARYIDEKRDVIRGRVGRDITDAEFDVEIEIAKLRGLNPMANQFNMIKRSGRASYEPTIDGFRLIAARTSKYAGSDEYEYDTEPDGHNKPLWARCTVYRIVQGQRCAFTHRVFWHEYGQTKNNWATMPFHMLGKTAESGALRKAFPEDLSGLYTDDEMAQADSDSVQSRVGTMTAGTTDNTPRKLTLVYAVDGLDQSFWTPLNTLTTELGYGAGPHTWQGYIDLVTEAGGILKTNGKAQYSAQHIYKAVAALPKRETARVADTTAESAPPAESDDEWADVVAE